MKHTVEIFNAKSAMQITIELDTVTTDSSSIYHQMSENQIILADKIFGMPVSKLNLKRAKMKLDRAENAVTYWHERVHILKEKLDCYNLSEDRELTEAQILLMCKLDVAERTLKRKLDLCGAAYEAVLAAEAAYTSDVNTFKVLIIK